MEKTSVEAIVAALNSHQVQYLIAGGLAVVAHGYVRFTADLDLILAVDPDNLKRAVEGLKELGYRPRAPVPIEQFLDAGLRKQWTAEKGMKVFSLFSASHPATEVDLFLEPPLDFSPAYARAARLEIAPGLEAAFCAIDDLISLKERAGRSVDLQDIVQLQRLRDKGKR
jgi:hypothetical protein